MLISLGLVSLTISFMLAGNLLVDVAPDRAKQIFKYRLAICETLAVQYSKLAERGNFDTIETALGALVQRNDDVLSASLIQADGTSRVTAGNHALHWIQPPEQQSTLTHVQVPIFAGDSLWGTLQVSFDHQGTGGGRNLFSLPWVRFILFMAGVGFFGYLLFMKKTLRDLDPSAVIPQRVKAALDILSEGVVLLDPRGSIVLANEAFAQRLNMNPTRLLGRELSNLSWARQDQTNPIGRHPWTITLEEGTPQAGEGLMLTLPTGDVKKFIVNCSPILDGKGKPRGVLTSFNDITEMEAANTHLLGLVTDLQASQETVLEQKEELTRLATRDPPTGCYNRHTFLAKFEEAFATAKENGDELGCIFVDIDHLRQFNEQYGHAVGDQVINIVARTLNSKLRPSDVMGRYGGEEFCIFLPGASAAQAAVVAERLRNTLVHEGSAAIRSAVEMAIAATFGVSSIAFGASSALALIDKAEKAVYAAKQAGGDRVLRWDQTDDTRDAQAGASPQEDLAELS